MDENFYKLMLITNRNNMPLTDYLEFIKKCVLSGVTCVQLREKNSSEEFLLDFGIKLQKILNPLNIPLIINDYINVAIKLNAAGVHLGQTDGNLNNARKLIGKGKIIGISIEDKSELELANKLDINYVAASAVFPTTTKSNLKTIWGLEGLKELSNMTNHKLIAIGGVNLDNSKSVLENGADGIAVISALHDAENPALIAEKLRSIIDNKKG